MAVITGLKKGSNFLKNTTMDKIDLEGINTGDLILTSGSSELSRAIQKFQCLEDKHFGKFSHSGTAWWCYGELFIVEMQKPGLVASNFVKHYCNDEYKAIIVLKPHKHIDGEQFGKMLLPYVGNVRYDFVNLIILQPIKIVFHKFLGSKMQKGKRWICHEASAFFQNTWFEKYGIIIFQNETGVNAVDLCRNSFYTHHQFK